MRKIIILIGVLFACTQMNAQCIVDSTFGTNGEKFYANNDMWCETIALHNDKILIAANPENTTGHAFVQRLNDDGSVDNSFGVSSKRILPEGTSYSQITDMQMHNGIVYVAYKAASQGPSGTSISSYITAIDATGSIITSFGNSGKISVGLRYMRGLKIAANGDIYITGNSTLRKAHLKKYLASTQALDTSFDTDGEVDFQTATNDLRYEAWDVEIDQLGKAVVVGLHYHNTGAPFFSRVLLRRYNQNGSLDNSFATNGMGLYTPDSTMYLGCRKLHITQSNGYAIGGYAYNGNDYDVAVLTVDNNGTSSSTFGTNGWVVKDLKNLSYTNSVFNSALLPDGRILVNGSSLNQGVGSYYSMYMLNTDGTPDTNFAPDGTVFFNFVQTNVGVSKGMAIDPNGKIILGGAAGYNPGGVCINANMALVRFNISIGAPTGTTDILDPKKYFVYPNPNSSGTFYINANDIKKVTTYNISGQKIKSNYNQGLNQIILPTNCKGFYFLKLETSNQSIYQKVLVQ